MEAHCYTHFSISDVFGLGRAIRVNAFQEVFGGILRLKKILIVDLKFKIDGSVGKMFTGRREDLSLISWTHVTFNVRHSVVCFSHPCTGEVEAGGCLENGGQLI